MELLRSMFEWEVWRDGNIFNEDTADIPTEFPCFVLTQVKNWQREEEYALYYYKSTFKGLLLELGNVEK